MSYKLKDIFLESTTKIDNPILEESMLGDLYNLAKDVVKNAVHGFVSRGEIAKIDKVIGIFKKMQAYGIKQIKGTPISVAIKELEREKRLLAGKEPEKDSSKEILAALRKISPRSRKSPVSRRRKQQFQMQTENKYSLKKIFGTDLLSESTEELVQNKDNPEYNDKKDDKAELAKGKEIETPKEKTILSDEEILAGLRDDVSVYGEYDPALGDATDE